MPLRAKKPEAIFEAAQAAQVFAPAGFGKIDGGAAISRAVHHRQLRGTENYDKQINAVGGAVYQTTDIRELVAEVKSLLTERHDFLTLVIDPITPVYQDLLDRCEEKVGSDFGRHYKAANKEMSSRKSATNPATNVVITSHAKDIYGPNMQKLGATFDSWKRLDYIFDLVIELRKDAKKVRTGTVHKTRIETFPDGETFLSHGMHPTCRHPTGSC